MPDWQATLQAEFERAELARARGNEGQARVCARRAAGAAAREYFMRRGEPVRTPSAYEVLKQLAAESSLAPELREAAEHLTLRVDEEFKLPPGLDLIAEARRLCAGLLGSTG